MMVTAKLDAVLRAVCPIDGVSIGRVADKKSWRIDFKPEATADQRTTAQAALDAFDPAALETQAASRRTSDGDELQMTRADNATLQLLDMTAAQRVAWARNNFPSLTQPEQTKLGLLLTMVALALRPQVR